MNNYLETIEIKNFKCFKDFKADGLKRVNLIGGKNNVGKTAFMEACYLNTYSNNIQESYTALVQTSYRRSKAEYMNRTVLEKDLKELVEKSVPYISKSNIYSKEFNIIDKNGIKEYEFKINKNNYIINVKEFSFDLKYIENNQYISNHGINNQRLKELFTSVQKKDEEELLYSYINEFDENILNFKVLGGEELVCKTIEQEAYQNIDDFGDGLKHYISIICSLYACEDGYLFIDEIDNGIHYTKLDRLWEIILKTSKEQNVQVFATTHSKECIESYARVTKKLEDEDISFVELGKNKNNELKAITMSCERLSRYLKLGNEVRGW